MCIQSAIMLKQDIKLYINTQSAIMLKQDIQLHINTQSAIMISHCSKTPGLSLSPLLIHETNINFTLLSSSIFAYIFSLWNRSTGAPPDQDGTCWTWMDSEALSPRCLCQNFLALSYFCIFPATSWIASFFH